MDPLSIGLLAASVLAALATASWAAPSLAPRRSTTAPAAESAPRRVMNLPAPSARRMRTRAFARADAPLVLSPSGRGLG